jgi:iron complex transport system substrate-binding protein
MKKQLLTAVVILWFFLPGCANRQNKPVQKSKPDATIAIKYAKGFAVFDDNSKTKVVIYNPWKKKKTVLKTFILVKGRAKKGEIRVPLDSAAVFSATQLNGLQMLHLLNKVTGISEARFISSPEIKKRLAEGGMVEMAAGGHYFIETILKHRPQAIFYSPFEGNAELPRTLSTLRGIPYPDYTETSPLGRAEWIKFTALFFGKEKTADSLFRVIEKKYLALKKLTDTVQRRPTLLAGKFFNGQWFVPGGKSYIARIFQDAGADYLWKDDNHTASFPLNFETIFKKAGQADYWRLIGTFGSTPSYRQIADENHLYTRFKAFKEHHIIYCDPQQTAYFERSAMQPQWILADFIKALHPQLLPHYQPKFYHILK